MKQTYNTITIDRNEEEYRGKKTQTHTHIGKMNELVNMNMEEEDSSDDGDDDDGRQ